MNRIHNSTNPFQGKYKKVLCVCSAGLLRSPTTAVVLSQEPYNYNTRAAGITAEYALIVVDTVLLEWADEIVCMEPRQKAAINERLNKLQAIGKPVVCLDIPDQYRYRDEELIALIKERYDLYLKGVNPVLPEKKDE